MLFLPQHCESFVIGDKSFITITDIHGTQAGVRTNTPITIKTFYKNSHERFRSSTGAPLTTGMYFCESYQKMQPSK